MRLASVVVGSSQGAGGRSSDSGVHATLFGASGFLGRYVTNYLGQNGSHVVVTTRRGGSSIAHLKLMGDLGRIIPTEIFLKDKDSIRRSLERSNVVINCIGKFWDTRNFTLEQVNEEWPVTLAELCKEVGIEKLVHVSALGAASDVKSRYLRTKHTGEQRLREVFPDAIIIRPGMLIGPEDKLLNWMAMMHRYIGFHPLFYDNLAEIQPVYAADVGKAISHAVFNYNQHKGRTFEVAAPEVYTQEDLFCVLSAAAEISSPPVTLNPTLSKLFGKVTNYIPDHFVFGDMSEDRVDLFADDNVLSGEPGVGTIADLGVKPVTVEEAGRLWLRMWHKGTPFGRTM